MVAQRLDQPLPGGLVHAQYLRHCTGHQSRIDQRGQVDEPDPVPIGIARLGGRLQRQTRLADATGPVSVSIRVLGNRCLISASSRSRPMNDCNNCRRLVRSWPAVAAAEELPSISTAGPTKRR